MRMRNTPLKAFAGDKDKKKFDQDAPGSPGKPGYEPPVTSMDYLTKTPNPTVASNSAKKEYNKAPAKGRKSKPSFPATPKGSKARAKSERAHDAREDAMGL